MRSAPAARIEQHASKRARRSLRKRAPDVVADLVKSCRGAVAVSSGLVEPVEPEHDRQNNTERPGDVADAHVRHVDHQGRRLDRY